MLQFSPSTSRVWQAATFCLIYSSLLGIIIRLSAFILLLTTILLLLTNGTKFFPPLLFSLLSLLIMFEFFYRFKVSREKPRFSVEEIKETTNLADLVTLPLAKLLLSHPAWSETKSLMNALSFSESVKFVLYRSGISRDNLGALFANGEEINLNGALQTAADISAKEGWVYIDELSLVSALFSKSALLQKLLFDRNLKQNDLDNILHWAREAQKVYLEDRPFWELSTSSLGLGLAEVWMGGWTLETEKYTKDINTEVLKRSEEYFLVGRGKEVSQLEQVLLRTSKRNAILLGEPGLGKTTIVYSLARKSVIGELPVELSYKRFMELDLTSINASANEGEIEQRLKNILVEVSHAGDVVLFVPNIENLAGALEGGKFDISGLLSQTLKDINLQVIGTSTRAAFHKYIEDKAVFADSFEVIDVTEPNTDEAIRILEEATHLIESKTGVKITYKAILKAVELSERYLIDKVLPGKAINLVDEAAANIALSGKKLLEESDIEHIISDKAKVPAGLATGEEKDKLLQLEKVLHQRIVSQDEAISAISQAVRRARTLKRDSKKPIGVFLFLGPTGVGKTETAKALAEVYYGSEERILRFDMSEFNQENSVYRLIGSPPGSSEFKEGGQLTEAVRVNPFSLILLDELEKAHSKVLEIFLAIFDEGRITDSSGRPISFTNTIIIGTSNAGAEYIREQINSGNPADLKKSLIEKLLTENTFRPEFINRFDDVIVYRPLDQIEVTKVVEMLLNNLARRLEKQDLTVKFTPALVTFLAKIGYDPQFGARPLQRAIQDQVEAKISQAILEGKLARGAKTTVTAANDQVTLS
ncbi:MAG TPA: ATP-dependent Clp protease ATP-binding subunit [Candidatus Saccharimonadales bacterium]|nr:ATP-dependent Clp protease ATP-binding subunit [Candidatus Saccharimonadales bacterium]